MKILNNYVVECSGTLTNSQITDDKIYEFPVNSFITDMTVSIEPTSEKPIFYNVEQTNCIQPRDGNSHWQAIYIPKGAYDLDELTALLNDNLLPYDITIDIITSGENYGKAKITLTKDGANPNLLLDKAPDIMRIYQLNPTYYKGTYISNNIVDITSGLQTLSIYSPIVKSAIQSVAHSKNNLLCTMQITNIKGTNTQQFNNIFIPVQRYVANTDYIVVSTETNKRVEFNAKMTIHMNVSVVQPHMKKDNVDDVIQTDLNNTMKLLFPVRHADESFDYTNTVELPNNSYITRITVLSDAEIANITSDNTVVVDGQNLVFKAGTYDLDKFLSILAESTATFNLITSGENTYKMKIEDFQYMDFTNAQEVKNILGFTDDILRCKSYKKVFTYTGSNTTMSITTAGKTFSKSIPAGKYTEKQFMDAVGQYIFGAISELYYMGYQDKKHFYEYYVKRAFTINSTTLDGWFTTYNEGTPRQPEQFTVLQDTAVKVQFQNGVYPVANGIIVAGTYSRESMMQALLQIINSTGANWEYYKLAVRRPNTSAPTAYITGIDRLPIIPSVVNAYTDKYSWSCVVWRIPKLGHAYVKPMQISMQGATSFFYLQNPLTIHYGCGKGETDFIIPRGKQHIRTVLDGLVAAANSFTPNSWTYQQDTTGTAFNVTYPADADFEIYIKKGTNKLRGLLNTYFNIPTLPDQENPTFVFTHTFNEDFNTYTPYNDFDYIPEGTQFTYTHSQSGTETTTTFTFTEELSTDSIGEILEYINTKFLIPTFNKAGDTNKLVTFVESPLGTVIVQHLLANGRFGRSTSGKQLLDILTLDQDTVFFHRKPVLTFAGNWHTPTTWANANIQTALMNNMKCFTDLCHQYTVTRENERILINHANTELNFTVTGGNPFTTVDQTNTSQIKFDFQLKPYNYYVEQPLTITVGNQSTTVNFKKTVSQEDIISMINDAFFSLNVPISWKIQEDCYSIVANQQFTFSGPFKNNSLPKEIIPYGQATQVVTYKFFDGSTQQISAGEEQFISDKVVNLTNNKEVCKIYCDLVKSWWGCNGLLTTLHITDLHKNYYSDIELIPLRTSFNKVNFKIHDLADNIYAFNGTIYIELEVSSP